MVLVNILCRKNRSVHTDGYFLVREDVGTSEPYKFNFVFTIVGFFFVVVVVKMETVNPNKYCV